MTPLSATISSIEGDIVTLSFQDGQSLRLPLEAFAGKPSIDASVDIIAAPRQASDAATRELSRHVINELLGTKT
jgi:hypothetical protein